MTKQQLTRRLLPEEATLFIGFDHPGDESIDLIHSEGYDTYLNSIFVNSIHEEDLEETGSLASVSIFTVSRDEFEQTSSKEGYVEITDSGNSELDISLANKLGVYAALEEGLEEDQETLTVADSTTAKFRIFISKDLDTVEVFFNLQNR